MVLGVLLDGEGQVIDRCLAVTFAAGHSYTGEDSAEFHCHGSPVVLAEGLRALFAAGVRQAGRGGVHQAGLPQRPDGPDGGGGGHRPHRGGDSTSRTERRGAAGRQPPPPGGGDLRQAPGGGQPVFTPWWTTPTRTSRTRGREEIDAALAEAEASLRTLLATANRGRVLRSGVPAAIVGRPNVGKSSLLNALVGYDRAIVTDVAGTTRDTVEEKAGGGGRAPAAH